jgi:hypothetical protein
MRTMKQPLLQPPGNMPRLHTDKQVKGKTKQLAKNVL